MKISFTDENVRKKSATLGFIPDGGFEDYAKNKCLIIVHGGKILAGYLMLLIFLVLLCFLHYKCFV